MRLQAVSRCCIALALVLALVRLLPANAATGGETRRQTRGEVDFIAGAGPVDPLDPDFPDTDAENTGGIEPIYDGDALSLNAVPLFRFAEADGTPFPASLTGERLYALYSPQRPYAQVSDLRGTGGGWKLSVSATRFEGDDGPALPGAALRLSGGTALSSNGAILPPTVNPAVTVACTDDLLPPVTVAEAAGDSAGMGAWVIRWYPLDDQGRFTAETPAHMSGVALSVPAGVPIVPGNYTATLYWTLSDTV